jgi:mRNA-degrading endonuclease toxin of MazEF toxin-antitoxin module
MVERGDVWWGPAPHKSSASYRPWIVVSDASHSFATEECIGVALTTTNHDQGIPVCEDYWVQGGSEVQAVASPWYVTTMKVASFDSKQGRLRPSIVSTIARNLRDYVPVHST